MDSLATKLKEMNNHYEQGLKCLFFFIKKQPVAHSRNCRSVALFAGWANRLQ